MCVPPNCCSPKGTVSSPKRQKPTEWRRKAVRFALKLPAVVRWKEGDRTHTIRASTKNISRKGLYLYARIDQAVGSEIEVEVELPAPLGGKAGSILRGSGRVVRREDLGDQRVGLAASLYQFELQPIGEQTASLKSA